MTWLAESPRVDGVIQSTPVQRPFVATRRIWVWVIIPRSQVHHHKLLDSEPLLHLFYLRQRAFWAARVARSKTDTTQGYRVRWSVLRP